MLIYQVLPRLWAKGKFSDWQAPSFRHLRSLGVDVVWFTGIIRHSTGKAYVKGNIGSPYSIVDYYDVNPYLADRHERRVEEFKELIERSHKAGLKVIIDYVPNHVSPDCKNVPVHDFYDYDWKDTLKIDYSNSETWNIMLEIALFWASQGVDGFRCDMVELVPPEFLKYLISSVKKTYPSFVFIGEVYEKSNYRKFIRELGFDYLYDKSGFYDIVRDIMCAGRSSSELSRNWQELGDLQGNMLNFLENHDEQRIASSAFAGSPQKAYAALTFGALFNNASFMLYAGQELGESAENEANGRTSIFDLVSVPTLKHLTDNFKTAKRLPIKELRVLSRYKKILSYARKFEGFFNWDLCYCQPGGRGFNPDRHFVFLRYGAKGACLVFCNFSDEPATAAVVIPEELKQRLACTLSKRVASEIDEPISISAKAWDASLFPISK